MSTARQDTRKLTVFPSFRKGDTLVVSPAGDAAGFGGAQFAVEQTRILKALDEPGVRNLIVDLGSVNYIGGTMIGALNRFVVKARERGGRSGFCNLSADMEETVRILNLQRLWTVFPTRNAAVREIVTETVPQQLAANRKALGILACMVLVVAAWFSIAPIRAWIARATVADRYRDLAALWDELQERRATIGKTPAWEEHAHDAARKIEEFARRVAPAGSQRDPTVQMRLRLYWAARYELLPMVRAQRRDRSPEHEQRFHGHMEFVRKAIEREQGVSLAPVRPPYGADGWPGPTRPQPVPTTDTPPAVGTSSPGGDTAPATSDGSTQSEPSAAPANPAGGTPGQSGANAGAPAAP